MASQLTSHRWFAMESKSHVYRRWKRTILFIACMSATGAVLAFGWLVYISQVQRQWHEHVELLILRLTPRRPADLTEAQWAHCIFWTWNLHANYGHWSYFPMDQRDAFVTDFERHLSETVTVNTID